MGKVAPFPPSAIDPIYFNRFPSKLKKWRAALAKARTGGPLAKILVLGDSTAIGAGSDGTGMTNCRAKAYPAALAQLLTDSGVRSQANSFFGDGWAGVSLPVSDPRVAMTGGWSSSGNRSVLGGSSIVCTSAGTLSFTPTASVKYFDIRYTTNTGDGSFSADIDGAGTVTQSCNSAAGVATLTLTAGASGTHTCNLNWVSGTVHIISIEGRDTTDVVSVWNAGKNGAKIADLVLGGFQWSQIQSLYTFAPQLTLLCCTINDAAASTDTTTYTSNMQAMITALKTIGDVVLVTGLPSSTATTPTARADTYRYINYTLAAQNDCLLIDMTQRFISQSAAYALGLYADALHGNAAGYYEFAVPIANAIARA